MTMKTAWERQARRIDALSLRERAMMFASIAAALVALTDATLLTPRLAEQKALLAQQRERAQVLRGLREGAAGTGSARGTPATPAEKLERELAALRTQRTEADAEIARRTARGDAGARLPQLLERVLQRDERLTLLRLATLADAGTSGLTATPGTSGTSGITGTSAPSAAPRGAGPAGVDAHAAAAQVPMQAVDIAVRGSYPDLARYVADTEAAMPALRWGELSIENRGDGPVLQARVYLVGGAP